ncbi:MAG TPA: PAS domain S-box protein [Bryobacteraceae bacterium]|nr:PAS domain S-box protein [Bryobacteraceae bacterium]
MTPAPKDPRHPPAPGSPVRAVVFFAIVAIVVVATAYRYYRAQKEAVEHEVRNQLLSIADMKVKQIADWTLERRDAVQFLMADSAGQRMLQRAISGADRQADLAEARAWLNQILIRLHYASATLTDANANPVIAIGTSFGDANHLHEAAIEALHSQGLIFHDLRAAGPGKVHMAVNLPLRTKPEEKPFGALLLGIDPAERLYPMLAWWPVDSKSGETVLVRREGDAVVYLNGTRFHPDAALHVRIALISHGDHPAVQAVLGARGIVEGMGIHGARVIAAVRAVPDLPWFLVAKVDAEEVEAPIRRRSLLLILATASLLLAGGAALFTIWRRQQLRFYRARYEAELERQALVGHYDYLSRFANDIILLLDHSGRILEANDRAAATYGFTREQLLEKTVRELRHPGDIEGFERQWREVSERGSGVFESVHQTREGVPIPVEISARFLHVGDKQFRQAIIRDISERKALDEKLRAMLDAHTAVIESSPGGIVTLTPEFLVAGWNKAAERIFGWTTEEIVGGPPLFVPPDRAANAKDIHKRAMLGEVLSGQRGWGLCKDGRRITLSISAAALHDRAGHSAGVVLNFLDTTEQTTAEEALRRNEAVYRATFDQAAVGMNYVSLDGRFLRVNPRYCRLLGYSQEELLGRRFQEITYPGDLQDEAERVEKLLSGHGATTSYNKRFIRKDGSLAWLHVTVSLLRTESGEPLHFVGVVEDVTERVQAEEALRNSEERFRRVVENAPEGIVVERDRLILYVNAKAVALFGALSASELVGRDMLALAKPEERAEITARSNAVAQRAAVPPAERTFLRLDGTPFPVEVSATPIEYDRQPASLVFLRDISERKQAEAEKRGLEEQLRQVQKMESLGRLAGGVAHDFNNHLTVINGYCDMLLANLEPGSRREEIEEIRAAGQRAGSLTQQLLAFSRKQMAERKPLALNEVVAESEKMLSRLIGEQVQIVTSLDPSLGMVVADRSQIIQILMNLVINARDAMPGGGRILIETANADLQPDSLPSKNAVPGPFVVLSIADTGEGMSEETLQHVFEPFFTTKGLGLGTGLGLSTVYGTVRQSGGWIEVDSCLGEGSRFRIYLPRVEAAAPAPERQAPASAAGGTETILVAEDQQEVRRLALRILKSNGYRLLEASSGPEALELSRRHDGPIDLLLTDLVMPEMSGRELAARMQKSRPNTKVLYVSGYTADLIGREGVLDQGVDYLPKPFTAAQLSLKVREVLGQKKPLGRILVIDDDDAVRTLLQQTLADAGYEAFSARDGREGMRLVANHPFDLVLTDLIMPDQEGIETIRRLHRDHPSIRIVAISGAMDAIYLKTAELLGAHAALRKPIDGEELLRTIRELLG